VGSSGKVVLVTRSLHAARSTSILRIFALSMLTNPAGVVGVIVPAIVSALVQGRHFPLPAASFIAAAELVGLTIALLSGPAFVRAGKSRLLALICAAVAITAHLLSSRAEAVHTLAFIHAVAGVAEGVIYAIAVAALARAPAADRAFGVMISSNHVASSVLLALIAWIAMRSARDGPGEVIAIFLAITMIFFPAIESDATRRARETAVQSKANADSVGIGPAFGGMLAVFLLSSGFGAVWPLVGQIAVARALQPELIARMFTFAGIGGIVGGMVAALIGTRFGRLPSLIAMSLGLGMTLALPAYPLPLTAVGFAILIFWTMSLPYYLGMASSFDRTGRLAVATTAMIPCGIAAGQVIAGRATTNLSLGSICIAGGCVIFLAIAVISFADKGFRRLAPAGGG
jgi:MFS transporter, DHA1 family, inner membrane transport protein